MDQVIQNKIAGKHTQAGIEIMVAEFFKLYLKICTISFAGPTLLIFLTMSSQSKV